MDSTYVYCIVSAPRQPRVARAPRGLPAMGAPRVLEIDRGLFAIVASAPPKRYNAAAINRGLSNLDWVSRAAVAHEAVVEHFIDERAVLPMKLFTIFANDERALAYLRSERARFSAAARRVSGQVEWGLRLLVDRQHATRSVDRTAGVRGGAARKPSGAAYLAGKKAQRDAASELATQARKTAAALYTRMSRQARASRKRSGRDAAAGQGILILDAAFLVPRSRGASFRALAARQARTLGPKGYTVTLTGPWPPYTFVQD